MDRFSKYHPSVNLIFFLFVIILSCLMMNPVYLAVSFLCAFLYSFVLAGGKKAFQTLFGLIFPIAFLVALFNMLFSRYGVTVLFRAGDTQFTLEALFYGFFQGLMLGSVLLWFSAFQRLLTAERLLCVFGRLSPSAGLTFSMTLRFIPLFQKNAKEIREARLGLNKAGKSKFREALKDFSVLVTMSLEGSIETADSMTSREYGKKKRKPYSHFPFQGKDGILIAIFTLLFFYVLYVKAAGDATFIFEPVIRMGEMNFLGIFAFFILCFLPTAITITEEIRWRCLKSRV